MRTYQTFEEAYRQQPFSELVRLGIGLAGWINDLRRRDAKEDASPKEAVRA